MKRNQVLEFLFSETTEQTIEVGDLCFVSPHGDGKFRLANIWDIQSNKIISVNENNVFFVERHIAEDFTFLAEPFSQFMAV